MTSIDAPSSELVSVVVPVFRTEAYLNECVASVLAQTHRQIEVILVDDGSDDGAPDLCDAWGERDERVVVVHRQNGGLSAARNTGIAVSRGDWISFVDSDDIVDPEMLTTLISMAKETNADIASCDLEKMTDGHAQFSTEGAITAGSGLDLLLHLMQGGRNWEACGKVYRRTVFGSDLRFQEGVLYEDLELIPRAYHQARRAVHTTSRLYGYRLRTGSIMGLSSTHLSPDLIKVLQRGIDFTHSRHPAGSSAHAQLFAALLIHGSSKLEQIAAAGRMNMNEPYLAAYRAFIRRNLKDVVRCGEISPAYRTALVVSALSPFAFGSLIRVARWSKMRLVPSLRRRA